MLHDIVRVSNETWHDALSLRQFDLLPEVILMLMARIRRLKTVRTDIDLQHELHDVLEWCVVNAGTFIDSVTGVETNHFRRNAAQAFVNGFHVHSSALATALLIES